MIKKIRNWNRLIKFIISWRKQGNSEFSIITSEGGIWIQCVKAPRKNLYIETELR